MGVGYLSTAVIVGPAKRPLILGAAVATFAFSLLLHGWIERMFREMTPVSGTGFWWAIMIVVPLVSLIHPFADCMLELRRDH